MKPLPEKINQIICGDWIEVLKGLPATFVHCVVTSPPYWGQRLYGWGGDGSCQRNKVSHNWSDKSGAIMICTRCDMKAPTLGLEPTPEEHIKNLVTGFREVRRVMRDDAVMFLNYGDKFGDGGRKTYHADKLQFGHQTQVPESRPGIGDHGLLGLPWRLALALQMDGWYLRSDIIWAKALSFCPTYSGSTMPESVNGWRWERHKVKVKGGDRGAETQRTGSTPGRPQQDHDGKDFKSSSQWQDCPGCPKCEPNGGLVLRKGSWRPTRAHDYLFMLTKTDQYYCDIEAIREECAEATIQRDKYTRILENDGPQAVRHDHETPSNPSGRNLRDVWCINPQAYSGAHYATFPEKLVEPCIKVATSERGVCPKCGAPWVRIINRGYEFRSKNPAGICNEGTYLETSVARKIGGIHAWPIASSKNTTLGWRPTCKCGIQETLPAIVLDPFMGSGTVALVAPKLKRNWLGIEINPDYVRNHAEYRAAEGETGLPTEEQRHGQKALFAVR